MKKWLISSPNIRLATLSWQLCLSLLRSCNVPGTVRAFNAFHQGYYDLIIN